MSDRHNAPYGTWKSPITSDLIVSDTIRFDEIAIDGDDVYWIEMRPTEAGRYVLVRRTPDGRLEDLTPVPFNVRTRVHEYGGGTFAVNDATVYFSNFDDQRLYRRSSAEEPVSITPDIALRYADGEIDRLQRRMICVREDHTATGSEAVNTLVSIDLQNSDGGDVIRSGRNFYSSRKTSCYRYRRFKYCFR